MTTLLLSAASAASFAVACNGLTLTPEGPYQSRDNQLTLGISATLELSG